MIDPPRCGWRAVIQGGPRRRGSSADFVVVTRRGLCSERQRRWPATLPVQERLGIRARRADAWLSSIGQGHFTAPAKRLRAEPAGVMPNGDLTDSFVPSDESAALIRAAGPQHVGRAQKGHHHGDRPRNATRRIPGTWRDFGGATRRARARRRRRAARRARRHRAQPERRRVGRPARTGSHAARAPAPERALSDARTAFSAAVPDL